jgi:hypothetical protein
MICDHQFAGTCPGLFFQACFSAGNLLYISRSLTICCYPGQRQLSHLPAIKSLSSSSRVKTRAEIIDFGKTEKGSRKRVVIAIIGGHFQARC